MVLIVADAVAHYLSLLVHKLTLQRIVVVLHRRVDSLLYQYRHTREWEVLLHSDANLLLIVAARLDGSYLDIHDVLSLPSLRADMLVVVIDRFLVAGRQEDDHQRDGQYQPISSLAAARHSGSLCDNCPYVAFSSSFSSWHYRNG